MTPAAALLTDLSARGVTLRAENGTLRYRSANGKLSPADRDALRAHKPALLALLSGQTAAHALTTLPDPPPLSPAQQSPVTGGGVRVINNHPYPCDQGAQVVTNPAPDDVTVALEADTKSLMELAAIMKYEWGLPQDEAQYYALTYTRFRVWRLTLDDGSTCTHIVPDTPTIAEFQPLPALACRVVNWESVAASALLDSNREV